MTMSNDVLSSLITRIHEEQPLIHNITNTVVTNFTANGLLALGASPVMAYAEEEVADMVQHARALVLNIGTLTTDLVNTMVTAGKAANKYGVPVLLDPVGAGATPYRTDAALRILREVEITLIRGNAGEISHLIGEGMTVKGVDAGQSEVVERAQMAVRAARTLGTTVVVSGPEDVITNGDTGLVIKSGHPLLTRVTGTGCLLTSVIGAFLAVHDSVLEAGAAGLGYYGAAASIAGQKTEQMGTGSFQIAFLDELSNLEPSVYEKYVEITDMNELFIKEEA
ncbi:hydroxyethylthiazole kinase [Paenibacillus provencensis]|uniref:Hydroxyethylthiazole kinase n=2 Tax=Paenibacillus TaxID=44249 RepID=A0ABW3Q3C3_9BACL